MKPIFSIYDWDIWFQERAQKQLFMRMEVDIKTNCWNYPLRKGHNYGQLYVGYDYKLGKSIKMPAHRVAYELAFGKQYELEIDHLCRNGACIYLPHLEAITPEENLARRVWRW